MLTFTLKCFPVYNKSDNSYIIFGVHKGCSNRHIHV